jgi:hypothetical protein
MSDVCDKADNCAGGTAIRLKNTRRRYEHISAALARWTVWEDDAPNRRSRLNSLLRTRVEQSERPSDLDARKLLGNPAYDHEICNGGKICPKISIVCCPGPIPPKIPHSRTNVFPNPNQNADTLSEGYSSISNPVCRVVPLSHCQLGVCK